MLRASPICLGLVALLAGSFMPGTALGADAETCARSYEGAQSLRKDAKPVAARRELLVCAAASCPTFVRHDCTQWLSEIESEIPSIAVRVHGVDGCDQPDATITIDGTVAPGAAAGRSLEIEPGSHPVRVTLGTTSTEKVVVVSPGERRRIVLFDLGAHDAVCGVPNARPAPVVGPPAPDADRAATKPNRIPTATWVLGGAAAVTGAVSLGFGISAWSQKGTLDDCKGQCARGDVDTMKRTFLVADITMFAAIASLGAAAYFYFTRR